MSRNLLLVNVILQTLCYLTVTEDELLEQLSTYVSSNGTDDTTCLNGGMFHPCKTLGYVLTNITNLQCTNCMIMINYSHSVFQGQHGIRDINITHIASLRVLGIGMPCLDFQWFGLKLLVNTNSSVDIQNMHFIHCGSNFKVHGAQGYFCIALNLPSSLYLYLFSLTNVTLDRCINAINVMAVNVLYYKCKIECTWILKVPHHLISSANASFNYTIKNCSFSTEKMTSELQLSSPIPGSLDIKYCRFMNINTTSFDYTLFVTVAGYSTKSMAIQNCIIEDNSFYGFLNIHSEEFHYVKGMVLIKNNYFKNNTCTLNHLIGGVSHIPLHNKPSPLKLTIVLVFNTFYNNRGKLLHFTRLPLIEIANCSFENNTVTDYAVLMRLYSDVNPFGISIYNVKFNSNTVLPTVGADKAAIVCIMLGKKGLVLHNVEFILNTGTSLALISTVLNVTGNVTFYHNSAVTGGGLYIDRSVVFFTENAKMNFYNNYAIYGGAIYIEAKTSNVHTLQDSVVLNGNTATVGHSIFLADKKCTNITLNDVTSLPINAFISNSTTFPGQALTFNVMLIDCFGRNTSCIADIQFLCDNNTSCIHHGHGVYLSNQGLPQKIISKGDITFDMKITSDSNPPPSVRPQIIFKCMSPTSDISTTLSTTLTLFPCPSGFTYNAVHKQCQCSSPNAEVEKAFICLDIGKACVKSGYWFGNVSGTITASKCIQSFCKHSTQQQPCTLDTTSSDTTADYVLLSNSQDDQCQYGHGGTLCTGCTDGTAATYGAVRCIPHHQCRVWHPYVLLLLNILYTFLIGVFLILVIQLKLSCGSGYLYGPLFYLAVLDLIPFRVLSDHGLIRMAHYYAATFLLQLDVLGFIPWCFFPSVNLLYAKYFELLAPMVVGIVLLLTVYLAKCVPRLFRYFQKSPIQGICILITISFWSLASTSIQVVTPIHLLGLNGTRVNLQPDLLYLHGGHIILWIVSMVILLLLLGLIIILIASPFLPINYNCIKPILDEFQSCYRDNIRWYGGVYFCYWIILQVVIITSNDVIFQTLLVILTITHCLIQPYSQKWLNVIDGTFLGCLTIISSLIAYDTNPSDRTKRDIIIYIFTILPLAFITVGVVWILLIKLGVAPIIIKIIRKCIRLSTSFTRQNNLGVVKVSHGESQDNVSRTIVDREPLIYYLQQEGGDYGAMDSS